MQASEIPQANTPETPSIFTEGPPSTLDAVQKQTKDQKDGTILLAFEIDSASLPKSLQSSPTGSLWRLTIPYENATIDLNVIRTDIVDGSVNKVVIRFNTIPGGIPTDAIWGKKNQEVTIILRSLAGHHPYPHFVERSERLSVLKRAAIACGEPSFQTWIAVLAQKHGFPEIPFLDEKQMADVELDQRQTRQLIAGEYICRIADIDSRKDVLTSNRAAERVENIIRNWRDHVRTTAMQKPTAKG